MPSQVIGNLVAEQFERVWQTLRDAIADLDESQFVSGEVAFLVPRNLAYHVVETADFYSSDCEPDGFAWGNVRVKTKAELLEYAAQVQAKVRHWCLGFDGMQLLQQQTICLWTGETVLCRALYSLRHAQHHTGQINAELHRRGLRRGEWA